MECLISVVCNHLNMLYIYLFHGNKLILIKLIIAFDGIKANLDCPKASEMQMYVEILLMLSLNV